VYNTAGYFDTTRVRASLVVPDDVIAVHPISDFANAPGEGQATAQSATVASDVAFSAADFRGNYFSA